MPLEIRQAGSDGTISIIDIQGRLDANASIPVKETLKKILDEGQLRIIMNLEKVDFMNSYGLGILVSALKTVRQHKGKLKFLKLQPYVVELFEITQLTKVFDIYDDEKTAIESF